MNGSLRLANAEQWQRVQDGLTDVLGLNIGLLDAEAQPLTRSVDVLRPPWNVLTSSPRGFARYGECLRTLIAEAANQKDRSLVPINVASLYLEAVPILRDGQRVAYFVMGPCLVGQRGQPDDYMALAREFDLRIDQWMEALQEIRIFSFIGLSAIGSLLYQLGHLLVPAQKTAGILEQLLDAAIQAVDAEAGSILVSGAAPDELVIQVARGLDDRIIRDTRVRVGEGVAGVVAAERMPLHLRRQTTDHPRLREALRRPELQDAMVVPILGSRRLMGVLCVSNLQKGRQLRENGIQVLQQLARLATETLS